MPQVSLRTLMIVILVGGLLVGGLAAVIWLPPDFAGRLIGTSVFCCLAGWGFNAALFPKKRP